MFVQGVPTSIQESAHLLGVNCSDLQEIVNKQLPPDLFLEELRSQSPILKNFQCLQNKETYLSQAKRKQKIIRGGEFGGFRLHFTPEGRILLRNLSPIGSKSSFKKITKAVDVVSLSVLVFGSWKGKSERDEKLQKTETAVLTQFSNSPGIVNTLEVYQRFKAALLAHRMQIIQPYINGGDLKAFLSTRNVESQFKVLALQLMKALKKLHEGGYGHGDIKAENILVQVGEEGEITLVLTDFGGAFKLDKGFMGFITALYSPPEVWEFQLGLQDATTKEWMKKIQDPDFIQKRDLTYAAVDEKLDVYSISLIFYTLLVGEEPFFIRWHGDPTVHENEDAYDAYLTYANWLDAFSKWRHALQEAGDPKCMLIFAMTEEDPKKRATVDEVLTQLDNL